MLLQNERANMFAEDYHAGFSCSNKRRADGPQPDGERPKKIIRADGFSSHFAVWDSISRSIIKDKKPYSKETAVFMYDLYKQMSDTYQKICLRYIDQFPDELKYYFLQLKNCPDEIKDRVAESEKKSSEWAQPIHEAIHKELNRDTIEISVQDYAMEVYILILLHPTGICKILQKVPKRVLKCYLDNWNSDITDCNKNTQKFMKEISIQKINYFADKEKKTYATVTVNVSDYVELVLTYLKAELNHIESAVNYPQFEILPHLVKRRDYPEIIRIKLEERLAEDYEWMSKKIE